MTLKEVAKAANVSVSTASKALKNSFDVSEETRARVRKEAERLDYFAEKKKVAFENRSAKHVRIAIVCPEVISPHYSRLVERLNEAALKHGGSTVIYNIGFDPEVLRRTVDECAERTDLDAVIVLSQLSGDRVPGSIPLVCLSNKPSNHYSVLRITYEAFDELKEKYRNRRIAFVGEPLTVIKAVHFKAGFPNGKAYCPNLRYEEAGVSAVRDMLREGDLPEVILCGYDEIAYGVMNALAEAGISVPGRVEVIGYNDIRSSRWVCGGLTAIQFDFGNTFEQMVEDLIVDATTKHITPREYCVPSRVVWRNTTK